MAAIAPTTQWGLSPPGSVLKWAAVPEPATNLVVANSAMSKANANPYAVTLANRLQAVVRVCCAPRAVNVSCRHHA